MFKILTLNNISPRGLSQFEADQYQVGSDLTEPDAILVRSQVMHDMAFPESVKAVGRAGAGVNNIPITRLSALGVPVFNTPGANANAVKELVLVGLLMASRNIPQALHFVEGLDGDDAAMHKTVEAGKKQFVGTELPGRTLGVVGLGAIGVKVANAAHALGMRVIGFDPKVTVENAWQLSAGVEQARSVEEVIARADYLSFHVPLNDHTRDMLNAERLKLAKPSLVVLNFSREGVVGAALVREALDSGRISGYVCDFPSVSLKGHSRVIALPHLGASTQEAEENCAVMVVQQVRDYLENGNIRNSVNFPEAILPRTEGFRVCIVNANVPNMLGQISSTLAGSGLNILDMLNKSKGDLAYTVVDVDRAIPETATAGLRAIEGVLAVRAL
ncbi:phosphoglycerate dehydrogenase [Candidatus Macondimonas diazotrophica]|uniref:D-3-phosphoglycerate dehydrogenase n=1 Tax=Candidatus Macondimonas diazotrophica TaxID=2305248 RepID=A0A4Z0FEG1_9GAMM|nr:phosphoglycerate dehydrogenase [Candidatus Macondimonas diazotrophica]NCU00073.1 phosphoglycerate dehydrogenase [Candidatus Macondimonas diazotrophica]TFZ83858.1 3-phosphoglycerate dehydrogenase [Candidatus Macondimonas diazotrophica]HBG52009.1 3-phosphoglycerate dehydrogenase [Gammaproteobacteria bacterium]